MSSTRDRSSLVILLLAVAVICSGLSNVLMYVAMDNRVAAERELRQEATALLERCVTTAERASER